MRKLQGRRRRTGIGGLRRYLFVGMLAGLVGLLVPIEVGSFDHGEAIAVAIVEAVCLSVIAVCVIVAGRHLEESRRVLWNLSRRDALTGVGNYRALQERLAEEVSRHERRRREFALITIDLNGFKDVNERLGHLEGDRLLAEIGAALEEVVRAEDSVFRQGGDEFAVIAPETNTEEALDVAARLRSRIAMCGNSTASVSAGTGFAVFPADGRTPGELLGRADNDLRLAKQAGRLA
jgi:diguanylate cyclase (GGDEF)-like protein